MQAAGVPIIPGTTDPVGSVDELLALGDELGYPLLIKAAAGGGGKGMEEVHDPAQAEQAFERARRQGQSYFANPDVYVEKLIVDPRHVEVQVLADSHGNVVHLGERDCTIQRRHQKLIEETPSPAVDEELRQRIGAIGVEAARACGYRSAGTIEGLLTQDGDYFFMEMNTRIQVEHTVTEMVTGLDLVREQILVALGEPLSVRQEDVELRGHAIECRINAEDAARGFLPAPAPVTGYREPAGPGVRVDSGVAAGYEVSGSYDPMVAKLIVHGVDREHARRRMLRALGEFWIEGPTTLIGFHKALLSHPCFVAGETCHGVVESEDLAARAAELDGDRPQVTVCYKERQVRTGGWSSAFAPSRWTGGGSRCGSRSPSRSGARSRGGGGSGRSAGRRRCRRQRRRRLADAGHGPLRAGGRRRRGRGRPGDLHRRGDEDGERGARAPCRHRREASPSRPGSPSRPARSSARSRPTSNPRRRRPA